MNIARDTKSVFTISDVARYIPVTKGSELWKSWHNVWKPGYPLYQGFDIIAINGVSIMHFQNILLIQNAFTNIGSREVFGPQDPLILKGVAIYADHPSYNKIAIDHRIKKPHLHVAIPAR